MAFTKGHSTVENHIARRCFHEKIGINHDRYVGLCVVVLVLDNEAIVFPADGKEFGQFANKSVRLRVTPENQMVGVHIFFGDFYITLDTYVPAKQEPPSLDQMV